MSEVELTSQVLPSPYVDRKRLLHLLQARFGPGNFRVQLCLNQWTIFVPEALGEARKKLIALFPRTPANVNATAGGAQCV
ncbi:hypothetical protein N431DRAFT_484968 [Stipitochalara longipes BDJ]|nr:hypothetical protein N431DRAFT_484968 [Stipitochalara longipes BDJ]